MAERRFRKGFGMRWLWHRWGTERPQKTLNTSRTRASETHTFRQTDRAAQIRLILQFRKLSAVEAGVQSPGSPCGIPSGQNGNGAGFSTKTLTFAPPIIISPIMGWYTGPIPTAPMKAGPSVLSQNFLETRNCQRPYLKDGKNWPNSDVVMGSC
jgi:hypothetical protein